MKQWQKWRAPGLIGAAVIVLISTVAAFAGDLGSLRTELQLIWVTNEPRSPDPRHKPIDADVGKLFENLPYKWNHYFEVNRVITNVPSEQSIDKLEMSKHCALDIKYLGKDHMQVKLYGDGKLVSIHKESLPLLLAGPANGSNAWFVLIREAPAGDKAK
jgi:hypothetical protein